MWKTPQSSWHSNSSAITLQASECKWHSPIRMGKSTYKWPFWSYRVFLYIFWSTMTPTSNDIKATGCLKIYFQFIFKTLQQASGCKWHQTLCMVSQLINDPFEATLILVDSNLKLNKTGCSNWKYITNQKNQTKGQLMLIFGVFTFFQKTEQKQVNK